MLTVGSDLFRLSPIAALVVVLAQALVLFLFSSQGLERWLSSHGLPTIPLVPVSSSQVVIGAVIGIGVARGGRNIQLGVLGHVFWGWVSTPIVSAVISFVLLFFVQNVFSQKVFSPAQRELSPAVAAELDDVLAEHSDERPAPGRDPRGAVRSLPGGRAPEAALRETAGRRRTGPHAAG
jgi:PiT family inorganic phosphate transporter